MLLTKPRRKIIDGLYWALLGAASVCFLCLYPRFPDLDHISDSVDSGSWIRIGALDWLWATQSITYWTTPPSIVWTFQVQWAGLFGNLLIVGIVVWYGYKGWRWSVRSFAVRGLNCDTCGYDLQGISENRCPECGEKKKEKSFPRAEWLWSLGQLLFAVFILGFSLIRPFIALGLLLDKTSELISVLVLPFLLMIILLFLGGLVVYPWMLSGRVEFDEKNATPRRRKSACRWLAWLPALGVLVWLACEMSFFFYNASLYYDADVTESMLLWWLPATVLYGGLMHVILARRLRKAFRHSGVCFECAKKLIEEEVVVCAECQTR